MILVAVVALLVLVVAGPHIYLPLLTARGLAPPFSTETPTPRVTPSSTFTPTRTPTPVQGVTPTPTLPLPRMEVSKQLSEPADGVATVGELLRFTIVLRNTGPTTITALPLVDSFDDVCMRYDSAEPPADNVEQGRHLAIWYNLGPLPSDQSLTVNVLFTARAACNPARNRAGVNDAVDENGTHVPGQIGEATVRIAGEAPTATPTRTPTGPPVTTATLDPTATVPVPTSTAPPNTTTTPTSR